MTKEERQILLKDLCMRLPYGVKVKSGRRQMVLTLSLDIMTDFHLGCTVKPYLRPMESMTEEEEKEFIKFRWTTHDGKPRMYEWCDYANEHHFDYRGLIDKGLALEAPEGMYNSTNNA